MANAEIGLMDVLNSCQDVFEAASYNNGGRSITKTTSGSSARSGNCGTNPIINPAATNKTGKGSFRLLAIAVKLIRIAIIKTTILKSSIPTQATKKLQIKSKMPSKNKTEFNCIVTTGILSVRLFCAILFDPEGIAG